MVDAYDAFERELLTLHRNPELTELQKRDTLVRWLNEIRVDETDVETAKVRTLARQVMWYSKEESSELGEALCLQAYFGFVSADSYITSVCVVLDACLQSGNDAIARQIGTVVSQALRKFSTAFGLNEALRDQLLQAIDRRIQRIRVTDAGIAMRDGNQH